MSERKVYNPKLVSIGSIISGKRLCLGEECKTRKGFIEDRSERLFNNEDWISERYLSSIEQGKNIPSFEKFIQLSIALEEDPIDLFSEILNAYTTIN